MKSHAAMVIFRFVIAGAVFSAASHDARGEGGSILLGIDVRDATSPEARQVGIAAREGAAILKVFPGYAAEGAGLQAGDVVMTCGDRKIATADDFKRVIQASAAGNRHRLTILRGGRQYQLDLVLGVPQSGTAAPPSPPPVAIAGGAPQEATLGMNLRSAGHPEAVAAGIESPAGAAVVGITAGAPAAQAGLRRGDLIVRFADREIQTYEDMEAAVLRCAIGSRQRVVFVRGNRRLTADIVLGSREATSPPYWVEQPGGDYRFRVPGRWGGYSRVGDDVPAERRCSVATSTEKAYEIECYRTAWQADAPAAALEQFVRQRLGEHPDGRSLRLALGNAQAAIVAFYGGEQRQRAIYLICLVHGNRRYEIHAYAPPLDDIERLPPVLADVLSTIQFRPRDVAQTPPLPVATPTSDPPVQPTSPPPVPTPPVEPAGPPPSSTPPPAPSPPPTPTPPSSQTPPAPAAPPVQPVPSQSYFPDEASYQKERRALEADAAKIEAAFEKKDAALATSLTHPSARGDFGAIFQEHQEELTRVGALLKTRKLIVMTPELAEYEVTESGHTFRISFEKHGGQWLLSSL